MPSGSLSGFKLISSDLPCQRLHKRENAQSALWTWSRTCVFSSPIAEKLLGRLRVWRISQAPRARLAKIPPERFGSVCIFQQLCSHSQKSCRGRRRHLRFPEAPRACVAKIRPERAYFCNNPAALRIPEAPRECSAKIYQSTSKARVFPNFSAANRREVARQIARLENYLKLRRCVWRNSARARCASRPS